MTTTQKLERKRRQEWGRRANIQNAAQDVALRKKAKRNRIYKQLCEIHARHQAEKRAQRDGHPN